MFTGNHEDTRSSSSLAAYYCNLYIFFGKFSGSEVANLQADDNSPNGGFQRWSHRAKDRFALAVGDEMSDELLLSEHRTTRTIF